MKNIVEPLSLLYKGQRKRLIIMRNALLIILISVFQVVASGTYSQTKKLSLNLEETTIKEVLAAIEDQSEFYFLYNSELIDVNRKVDISIENENVENVLSRLFSNNEVSILVKDKYIVLTPVSDNKGEQQKLVSGKVTDYGGEPLVGVTVLEKGTTHGTVTNVDGIYSLSNLTSDAILVFSFIGMESQEVIVGDQTTIDITLTSDAIGIDEVVVTALGIKREQKALGYSVQAIGGEELQKVPVVDVSTSLTGKVAGVLVQNSSDFNREPQIFIRGEDNPLIVIDGIAYANKRLSDIAAQDIESISILKGATATALYGFRGESGAILITTKNGSTGEMGMSVDISSNTMFNAGFLAIPEKQSTYGRGDNGIYSKTQTKSWGPLMDGTIREQWDPYAMEYAEYEYLPIGKNNFENFLETGYITNNNVGVSFRTEHIALRSSLNWTQQKGVYPNSKLDKYTYTLGGDINYGKFKLTSNSSYTKRQSPNMGTNGYTSYDVMYSLLIYSPSDFDLRDYKNNYWMVKDQKQNWTYPTGNINNPYFDRYAITNNQSRDIFNTDLSMSYDVADWLKVTARSGVDFYMDRGQISVSKGSWTSTGNTGVPGIPYPWNGTKVGAYLSGRTQGFSINSDLLLTGEKKFVDDKFRLEYLAGGTIYYRRDDNLNAQTQGGISIPGYYSLNASVNAAKVGESTTAEQANSLFGRIGLSWNNILYLDVTGRNDWTSRLANEVVAKSDRSYFYPSVSGSFVVSELLPESTDNWLDILKFRGSWTKARTAPEVYKINSVFTVTAPTWIDYNGATASHTLYLDSYSPNDYATVEAGFNAIGWQGRLALDVSYYNKRIYNQLVNADRTAASGITSVYLNSDEERARRGWDAIFNVTPVKNSVFKWDMAFNWGTYKEIYTKIDPVNTDNNDKEWVAEGKRTDFYTIKNFLYEPGTGELIWENGKPKRSNIYTFYSYKTPDWNWGISTTLKYKDLSLFMSFDGVVGGSAWSITESYMWQAGVHPESVTDERYEDVTAGGEHYIGEGVMVTSGSATFDPSGNILTDDRVFETNDVAVSYQKAVQALHSSSVWGGGPTPYDVYSRTFLKMREISLTYDVPRKLINKMGPVKSASISFVGQNVLFWAKEFKYSDPDGGSDDFSDPSVRYLGGNLKFSF